MMASKTIWLMLVGVIVQFSTALNAQESAQITDLGSVKEELQKAKAAVEEARHIAEKIILDAEIQARSIRAGESNDFSVDLIPIEVQRSQVAVELSAGTVEEIATAIMPPNWRVMIDVRDASLLQRRFQYVSTKTRDQALRDLLNPIGLRHQYFFDLKDTTGMSTPLLVISQR